MVARFSILLGAAFLVEGCLRAPEAQPPAAPAEVAGQAEEKKPGDPAVAPDKGARPKTKIIQALEQAIDEADGDGQTRDSRRVSEQLRTSLQGADQVLSTGLGANAREAILKANRKAPVLRIGPPARKRIMNKDEIFLVPRPSRDILDPPAKP